VIVVSYLNVYQQGVTAMALTSMTKAELKKWDAAIPKLIAQANALDDPEMALNALACAMTVIANRNGIPDGDAEAALHFALTGED
jgi:hypothetical protein